MQKNTYLQDENYLGIITELLENEDVKQLVQYTHHKYTNRLEHSLTVSYNSYKWAKRFNLDAEAVAKAGLLHDLFFTMMCDANTKREHLRLHPEVSLVNARKVCTLTSLEEDIILSHMFLVSFKHIPKYRESFLVSMIDKTTAIQEVIFLPIKVNYHKVRKQPVYVTETSPQSNK